MAIDEAKKSVSEEDGRTHPKVGVVVVKDGQLLAFAHRGEIPKCHAEFIVLDRKLTDISIVGATVYTTLEPCTKRNHPKVPCAQRLVDRKVARVVIGMFDPNPDITTHGQQVLRRANIITDVFPHNLMSEVEELNRDFDRMHRITPSGATKQLTNGDGARAALPNKRPKVIPVRYGRLPEGELGEALYLDNDGDPACGVRVEPVTIGLWTVTFAEIYRLKGEHRSKASICHDNSSITSLDRPWRESWDNMGRPSGVPLHIIYRDFDNRSYRSVCSLDRDILNRDSGFSVRFIGQELIEEASM